MIRQDLHDGWQLTATSKEIPDAVKDRTVQATVPGTTYLDLLTAGVITEPVLGQADPAWPHRTDWRYTTTFTTSALTQHERVDLVFDGLGGAATIELSGRVLGQVATMHRGYRFDIRDLITRGGNDLKVSFSSAPPCAGTVEADLAGYGQVNLTPVDPVRDIASAFGSTRGPNSHTAGIWRSVRLERWHVARLARVRPVVSVSADGAGQVELHADIEWADKHHQDLVLRISVGTAERTVSVPAGARTIIVPIEVPGVELWWPTGHGAQPLYDVTVELHTQSTGAQLDCVTKRIGFRTITVDTTPEELDTPFTVVVNGKPILIKGVDWAPSEHFGARITKDRLSHRVDQAATGGVNLLRIWGGGIYESDGFYDACDERGVLVWQGFPLSTALHSKRQPVCGELAAEARENVARLMPHASLAIWNGDCENRSSFADQRRSADPRGRAWEQGYYTELLPGIVAELDPGRFYCSPAALSSPSGFAVAG